MKPKIDAEFRSLIPPAKPEELAELEASLLAEGCRDALVVWRGILLDGHNRLEICTRLDIPYNTVDVELSSREAAADWIDRNQIGRRNLTPDQMRLIRGRRYNRAKKAHGGDRKSRGQNDLLIPTADRLAGEHGVSPATIKRDAKAVAMLDDHPEQAEAVIRGEKKLSDAVREIKRSEVVEHLESVVVRETKKVQGCYDVVVLDPPWPMQKIERDERPNQTGMDYPTMNEPELAALKIPCAKTCHVWLWTTHRFLPMALRLLETWKLKYVCTFVWHKPGGFQPVGLPQYNCEFALYARRGSPSFIDTKAFNVCFDAPRGRHSEKPEAFYDMVRRVTAGRRLDMFGRRKIDGFDTWGKEAP